MSKKKSLPAPWGRLLRLPNLLTVPGDPIVGFILASQSVSWDIAICAGVSLCLYCAGLVLNDIADTAEDKRDRPSRPIPSGEISVTLASGTTAILMLGGIALALTISTYTAIIASLIAMLIIVYNFVGKKIPILGPLLMGLCRGMSVFLGASAAITANADLDLTYALITASTIGLYITAVTAIARNETKLRKINFKRFTPALALLPWCILTTCVCIYYAFILPLSYYDDLVLETGSTSKAIVNLLMIALTSLVATALPVVLAYITLKMPLACAKKLKGKPAPEIVQQTIGTLIRTLLPIQAMFLIPIVMTLWSNPESHAPAVALFAAGLYMLWPISAAAGKRCYGS